MDTIDPTAVTERAAGEAAPAVSVATLSDAFRARYEIVAELGRGSGGQVFRAHDRKTERHVAVKFLGGLRSPTEIERFLREGRLLARLSSPNLVKVYELDLMDQVPYLVAELLEGGTLRRLLTGDPIPPRRAVELICQILDGLADCHAAGIVHRDLKPENVLFSAEGVPKVADLGVAHDSTGAGLTTTGALVGTPRYMSPEQARGLQAGPAADLYAAALMLHEMLTGRHPFPSLNLSEMLAWHVNGEVPVLEGPLGAAIATGLEKDPARRPASAATYAGELKRALARGRAVARSGGITPRSGFPVSRPSGDPVSRPSSGASSGPPSVTGTLSLGQAAAAVLAGGLIAFVCTLGAFRVPRSPAPGPASTSIGAPETPSGSDLAPARAAALAQLERAVEWGISQAELHHRSVNVIGKWMGQAAQHPPPRPHAKPAEIGTRIQEALLALEQLLPEAERISVAEAHALARARGLLIIAWTAAVLDAYLARGEAGTATLADFQGDASEGARNMWSAADAEYPPAGAEFLRRYFARLAVVSERVTAAPALSRGDLEHLIDLFRVGRCFSRVRWGRSAAREYTGALERLRRVLKPQEARPRGLYARALAASLAMGMDSTTPKLVARRFDELSLVYAEVARAEPAHRAWLDGFVADVAEKYGPAIESARGATAGRRR